MCVQQERGGCRRCASGHSQARKDCAGGGNGVPRVTSRITGKQAHAGLVRQGARRRASSCKQREVLEGGRHPRQRQRCGSVAGRRLTDSGMTTAYALLTQGTERSMSRCRLSTRGAVSEMLWLIDDFSIALRMAMRPELEPAPMVTFSATLRAAATAIPVCVVRPLMAESRVTLAMEGPLYPGRTLCIRR